MERLLTGRDRRLLERFLSANAAETMFLRSNLNVGEMTDTPEENLDAAYVGAFSGGLLVGVVSHTGFGMLLGHGEGLVKATRKVLDVTGNEVRGLTADYPSATAIVESLELDGVSPMLDSREYLYELPLNELQLPPQLDGATCRPPVMDELDVLTAWREAYSIETMGGVFGSPRERIRQSIEDGRGRVLEVDGELVSYGSINAELPDMVQIGGVWTPPERRGRGYGRSIVAGLLREARERGVETAVLFTAATNRPAQRAYEAIGFERIGETRIVLFDPPVTAD